MLNGFGYGLSVTHLNYLHLSFVSYSNHKHILKRIADHDHSFFDGIINYINRNAYNDKFKLDRKKNFNQDCPIVFTECFSVIKARGDGNCLYNSLAKILFGNEKFQQVVRLLCAYSVIVNYDLVMDLCERETENTGQAIDPSKIFNSSILENVWGNMFNIQCLSMVLRRTIFVYGDFVNVEKSILYKDMLKRMRNGPLCGNHYYYVPHEREYDTIYLQHSNYHFNGLYPEMLDLCKDLCPKVKAFELSE